MAKFNNSIHHLNKLAFFLGLAVVIVTTTAWGQPAPALRAVVPADAAPEAMSKLFAKLGDRKTTISIPGAAWLQLQFSEVRLGPGGVLTITDASGESQTFSQAQIDAWGGLSAVFNGSELRISLRPGQGAREPVSARIKDIIIGLPASTVSGTEAVAPQPLRNLLGPDIKRFIPVDLRGLWKEGTAPRQGAGTEAICGTTDDRIASADRRVGRIMPVGCTGWLIDGGNLLTAGHCIGANTETVEFNVPASRADGITVAPPVRDQYRVIAGSIVSQNGGVGNDWAVFQVLPNTETGLMPAAAQGATFQLSNTNNPTQVRITGYGADGPAPNFGAGGPRNTQNQTQQTHVGTLSQNTGDATSGVLLYDTDTQGGNSGSPVISEGGNIAIGIHTAGGCTSTGGTNAGTSFRNAALWTAIFGNGRILFYNAPTGLGATSRMDAAGNYTFVSSLSGFHKGWTHIVGASNGSVLFYDALAGVGATARIDAAGNYTFVSSLSGFSTWTHIVAANEGSLLFYNAATGLGATARMDPAGNYTFVSSISGFHKGWTHIVGASNGSVLFYDASAGVGATARMDAAGNYTFVSSLSGFHTGWTHIVGASNGSVLFYDASAGVGATARMDAAGNYTFVSSLSGFHRGWTHIVGASNGSVLFYDASAGVGATASIDTAGNYTFVSSLSGFSTWTHIAGL